jgi:type II secretory pathway pseudopilin PulG
LLVAIAIIAILASLLLSALAPAKAQAQRAYCQNNLHQLGLAMTMYGDETGQFPRAFDEPFPLPNLDYVLSWNVQLLPFVKNDADVFNCPSYPDYFRWDSTPSVLGNLFPANVIARQRPDAGRFQETNPDSRPCGHDRHWRPASRADQLPWLRSRNFQFNVGNFPLSSLRHGFQLSHRRFGA